MRAQTIEEVIQHLDEIIASARNESSKAGYFPALYRKVTLAVKHGIEHQLFEDGERMERLDVIFANRYLEAYGQYRNGERPAQSWLVAFEAAERWQPTVLQHLMLGINTHINLDLGIAAAETMEAETLHELQTDFFSINNLLVSMIGEVEDELAEISPALRTFDFLAGELDEYFAMLGIEWARDQAWSVAEKLANLDRARWPERIARLDGQTMKMAERILRPRWMLRLFLLWVRIRENRSVPENIDILS